VEGIEVYHPRYFLLPKISMPFHGLLMFAGSISIARRLHEKARFDCIDAHYVYPDGFAAVLLGRYLGIPVVVSARGTDISLFPSLPLIRPMIRWTLWQATGIVAVSQALRDAMEDLGATADKIVTIGNGIDLKRFHPMDRSRARQKLGIPEEAEVILSVGNLVPVKGHACLIPAISQMARLHPKIRLYIAGEGYLRARLEGLALAEGVHERVFFVGRRPNEEMKYWYSAADVSCLASSREGWANVLLESLACGTPLVATRVWGTPEVIVSDELGVLVEQSIESLAQGLELALQKQWNREALVRHAAARTWDVVAQDVERFLEACIGPGHNLTSEVIHA
jgi:glycosyltransferase involved in cell wall biosynthesis